MAIEYLVYADASLDLAKIVDAAIATGDFENAEPYRDFTCLNAQGVALQMKHEDSGKFSIVCADHMLDFSAKTLVFFRLSKTETYIGQINIIKFIRILLKNASTSIILFNNEENETPNLIFIKDKYYISGDSFWSINIKKYFPEFNLHFSNLKIIYGSI
jgi:hypothetical protein